MNQLQVCLANNMKRYRKLRGLSQEKLAEKSGASANYIALIECGKNFPSLPMIEHIAAALEGYFTRHAHLLQRLLFLAGGLLFLLCRDG